MAKRKIEWEYRTDIVPSSDRRFPRHIRYRRRKGSKGAWVRVYSKKK